MPGARETLGAPLQRVIDLFEAREERWGTLLVLAIVVGLLAGCLALGLHAGTERLAHWLMPLAEGPGGIVLPACGALLGSWVVVSLMKEPAGHGVPEVVRAVCRKGGRMRPRSIVSRWLGSLLHVGAGGSAGLEGPIVHSGAAVGATIAEYAHLDERRRAILVACGVAAGIAGIFHAPLTGLAFAMEIVLAEVSALSLLPVVLAAAVAAALAQALHGDSAIFAAPLELSVSSTDLLLCLGLGLACGLGAVLLTRGVGWMDRLGQRLNLGRLGAPALFGVFVGLIGFFVPKALGDGYSLIHEVIAGDLSAGPFLLAGLFAAKLLASSISLGSGAPGGVFAPSLVLGALTGALFHRVIEPWIPGDQLASVGSFALAGMGGMVAGTLQAPLTGILLVMEVTGGYGASLALMATTVTSLLVARRFERWSIYMRVLAEAGDLLRPGTDQRILADVRVAECLDDAVLPVTEGMTLADLVRVARRTSRNHFPVLDEDGALVGMLELSSVRELLLDPELARVTLVGTVMQEGGARVSADATLAEALAQFDAANAWVLPVVEGDRFLGLVSKSTLFGIYRNELRLQTQEG
jgi:CIC family chloride channel protein